MLIGSTGTVVFISIHAPLAGRDTADRARQCVFFDFNPRAPCGARLAPQASKWPLRYFNPRAPCGARLLAHPASCGYGLFQSTRPLRGATVHQAIPAVCRSISIHAPLAGRDCISATSLTHVPYFNPRAPCGARLLSTPTRRRSMEFQSTRPLRGATASKTSREVMCPFQSTRPCGARRVAPSISAQNTGDFNPRAPCGARRLAHTQPGISIYFNPRAPCGARLLCG